MLEAESGHAPSPREVDILFDIFDQSGEGTLCPDEMRLALEGNRRPGR